MELTFAKSDMKELAEMIAESLKRKLDTEPVKKEAVAEPVKELTAEKDVPEPVKEEVAAKQEEATKPQITAADLRKAVMEFTRNNQDNLTKAKEILSGLGLEQLSQLEGDLINQFVDKFVAIGGKI